MKDIEFEEITAEEAFEVLGNETRMAVLWALWDSEEPRSFAGLRRDVAPDDKGNFNYHLDRLTDHFVRKTDDGYVLRFAGERVVRAVLTGTITSDPSVPSSETRERCCYCGAPVEMSYEEETITLRCTDCGGVVGGEYPDGTYVHFAFPPAGLVDRDPEDTIDAAHVLYDSKVAPMMKGVCPECAGRVGVSHEVCLDHEPGDSGLCPNCDTRYEVWSTYACENCRYSRRSVTWFAALNHPAVVAFLHRHGLDELVPFRKLTWDNADFVRDITATAAETDPYRFRVTVPVGAETLVVSMDEALDVTGVERRMDGSPGDGSPGDSSTST